MPTTKKLDALKINKLTEAQLAAATVSEDELYLVTDAENPVDVKTDASLTGNGSTASPLSVSPNITATTISAATEGSNPNVIFFEVPKGTTTWYMHENIFEGPYAGEGNTSGQIGRSGATLDAVYAAKLCKDSTELSVRAGKTGDIAITSELPEAKTGTAGQVYTKTADGAEWKDASGGGSSADNNGLEGDYCSKYGIVDETASGLPTQGTGNQIIIPAQLVMDVPGVAGLTTNASKITHDLVSTTNCEIFLAEGTVIEATDVFFQTDEPQNGETGFAAWWNGTEWKFKSNDTGNVWRAANAVRIAKCIFTDGALTRLCFTGCRVLNKQEWLPRSSITMPSGTGFSYTINVDSGGAYPANRTYKIITNAKSSTVDLYVGDIKNTLGSLLIGKVDGQNAFGTAFVSYDDTCYLGIKNRPWSGIYTKTINGGANNAAITVPTTSGTMVVATPPTAAGNYVLKATVADDGTVTTQWVLEA